MAESGGESLWNAVLDKLKAELGDSEFNEWFSAAEYLAFDEKKLSAGFPSAFHRERVKKKYLSSIAAKLREISGREISLELEVPAKKGAKKAEQASNETEQADSSREAAPRTEQAALKEESAAPKRGQHPHLRDDYTFERYVSGENNNFAFNAAKAISKNPGTNYNPFFIYGGVGLGKTHLMQAIGNFLHENSDKKVTYITSEDFLNEYVEAVRENKTSPFKNKFRRGDVLMIDDVQFFADKPGVQEELFHTFNAVLQAKKQIVFTCDRPPSDLKKFESRLLSRFDQGLKVDLLPPRYEMRMAILRATAKIRGVEISDDVIDFISKKISSNVRDLLGALKTVIAYTELMGKKATLEIAQKTLKDALSTTKQTNLSIDTIQKVVSTHFSVSVNDLKGKKRNQNIVYPRQLAMYICREMTEYSSTEIGEAFGGRDHATVLYSFEKIRARFVTDATLDSTIENLKRQVKDMAAKL
ncbi:MAG: chromosomal replication initiator protein DnaA [Treponema sp.]|nr:chromosomal replication initiator protein DnaA [Treponema sp.]